MAEVPGIGGRPSSAGLALSLLLDRANMPKIDLGDAEDIGDIIFIFSSVLIVFWGGDSSSGASQPRRTPGESSSVVSRIKVVSSFPTFVDDVDGEVGTDLSIEFLLFEVTSLCFPRLLSKDPIAD